MKIYHLNEGLKIMRNNRVGILSLAAVAAIMPVLVASAADPLYIEGESVSSFPWSVTDGSSFKWDIISNGSVNDGSNDAYDGGMNININGNSYGSSGSSIQSAKEKEIQITLSGNGEMSVTRRIYVSQAKGNGYCRWIDIFTNSTEADATVSVQYHTNMGASARTIFTSTQGQSVTDKDWGVITCDEGSSRPGLVHIFATPDSTLKPTIQMQKNSDDLNYSFNLTIPAGKSVALCLFEMQRKKLDDAKTAMQKFDFNRELKLIPAPLRAIIANMPAGGASWNGSVALQRRDSEDCIRLKNGDDLIGKVQNASYEFDSSFGKITLDAAKVAGMIVPTDDDDRMLMILCDGQVISGKLTNPPIKFKLANGDEVTPPLTGKNGIQSVAYAASKEAAKADTQYAMLIRRNCEQLLFNPANVDWSLDTEYGVIKLSPSDLTELSMTTPEGGLHRAMFKNGSVLSGLLATKTLTLKLELGPELKIADSSLAQIRFQAAGEKPSANSPSMTLRNDDILIGAITDEAIKITTSSGSITLLPKNIAEIQFVPGQLGNANIKLHDGSTIGGQLGAKALKFKVTPGPEISVSVGHIVKFTNPIKPEEPKAPEATSQPATQNADEPSAATSAPVE